jgi:chromosomal replication initiator protein
MTVAQLYLDDIWTKTKNLLIDEGHVEEIVFNTYFEEASLNDIENQCAIVTVKTHLQKIILIQEVEKINSILKRLLDREIFCDVLLEDEYRNNKKQVAFTEKNIDDHLLNVYTFDNFIVGPSNKESHSAALACAYNPGKFYNPLFIYGNSGLGKTHLLNAVGNYVKKTNSSKTVYYTSSSDFVSQVVQSIKDNTIEEFKRNLQSLDVLLMDDVQFLAGKEKSHEIFFHVFNELVNTKKQIVITSDRHPTEIKGLEDRLISRFSSGLSVGVDSPEFETSLAILKSKMEHHSLDSTLIDDDVLTYIATNFSKDVRKLEGALNRLIFYSINFGSNQHIDFKMAIGAFKTQPSSNEKEITVNKIKRVVADYYGLTKQQLVSKARTKNISNARHIAIYLCRKHLDLPFIRIGEEFGKRDHSTIISSCEKIEKQLKKDTFMSIAIGELEKLLF